MKKIWMFYLAILGVIFTTFAADGASVFQRMGIPGGTVALKSEGTESVPAYCLDLTRKTPEEGTSYTHILESPEKATVQFANNSTEPLQQAINEGKISTSGTGNFGELIFQNHTSQGATVTFDGPTALGAQNEELSQDFWDNARTLLETESKKVHESVQSRIWLSETLSQFKKAGLDIQGMQRTLGVPETKIMDDDTWKGLIKYHELQELGYTGEKITPQFEQEFPEYLKHFQEKAGLPMTGKLDAATREEVGAALEEIDTNLRLMGFESIKDFREFHHLEPADKVDDAFNEKLQDDLSLQAMVERVQFMVANGEEYHARQLSLVRSCISQNDQFYTRVKRDGGDQIWVTDELGMVERQIPSEAIDEMENHAQDMVSKNSDEDVSFAYVGSKHEGEPYTIQFGDQELTCPAAEFEQFIGGNGGVSSIDSLLAAKTPGLPIKLVVYRDFRWRPSGDKVFGDPSRQPVDPVDFAKALKRQYKDRLQVYLDDETDLARKNISGATKVESGKDIAVYIEDGSFKVIDFETISNIKHVLKSANFKIVEDQKPTDEANLLVITGHKDENLRNYLMTLEGNDVFQDKTVVLASCYASGDASFNSRLIQEGGAKGILFFTEEIHPQAVEDVLKALSKITADPAMESVSFENLFDQAISQVRAAAPAGLVPEIDKMARNLMQVSFLESKKDSKSF